jgi:hypothetical protein
MTTSYDAAKQETGGLRSVLKDAVEGVKSIFGRTPEQEAEDDEKKQLRTWDKEIQLAENFFTDYQEDALRCVHAFLDESNQSLPTRPKYKLNLFHANINTLSSIMYAKLPKIEADRRFADPADDVARVAGEIITRILQNDMNDPEDRLNDVLKQALQDRLVAGLGAARIRYCMEEGPDPMYVTPGDVPDDELPEPPQVKTDEWCDVEYVHWRDILWSPARTRSEVRWKAFRVYLTKAEIVARFGKEIAGVVPMASRGPKLDQGEGKGGEFSSHQDAPQAEVWEIWDKASKRVYWFVKGAPKFLDAKDDPMGLDGFFPDAPEMLANLSTLKLLPKPDYLLAEDLYEEINELECRIALLTKACKVVGVYPASATEVKRLLTEATENQLIGVENWAMFADKGGLKGQIDYFPIKDVAEVLQILVIQQQQRINQLYQVTGMSDIIRGQASTQGVTATEQRIKAQFASTRMQAFQDEFAGFASELLNRKVMLIRKYYDPERIKRLSNIAQTPDAEFADQAIALIKDEESFDCRVIIRAESMSQIDFEALKAERGEFLTGVSSFLGSVGPLLEQMPAAAPFLMELLKFNLAGMKGAQAMEGVIDRAVAAMAQAEAEKANQPPEPTPEEKAMQIKVEGQKQIEQVKAEAGAAANQQTAAIEAQALQQEHAMEMTRMQNEMQMDREKHQLEMEKLQAQIQLLFAKLNFEQESQALEIEGQQVEQQMDLEHSEREFEMDQERTDMEMSHQEESFQRESEQSDERFEQESKHADQAARREASRPSKDE